MMTGRVRSIGFVAIVLFIGCGDDDDGVDAAVDANADGTGDTAIDGATCTPAERDCSGTSAFRECRSDGMGYVVVACPSGSSCSSGECVATIGDAGIDATTDADTLPDADAASDATADAGSCEPGYGVFDGASYASATFALDATAHTVEAWIYLDASSAGQGRPIISIGRLSFTARVEPTADVLVQYSAHNGLLSSSAGGHLTSEAWHHVAYVYTGGTYSSTSSFRYYIDGAQYAVDTFDGNTSRVPIPTSGATEIGREPTETSPAFRYFAGRMRDVRISSGERYSAAFVPEENLADDGTTLALWRFDDGSGSVAADASGAGHDADIHGVTFEPDVCTEEPTSYVSCAALLADDPAVADGVYAIDPDGDGPIAPVDLYCDMTEGGWTLVGNYFDSSGDDMPNDTAAVTTGWERTSAGFTSSASSIDRGFGPDSSGAVSLAFVSALGESADQSNLRMCFVSDEGADTTCRTTPDSMTLVSFTGGNPRLSSYVDDALTYTFGRLAGLAGSIDGYDYASYTGAYSRYVPRTPGTAGEFGTDPNGISEYYGTSCDCALGVWHGYGAGISFKPNRTDDCELTACSTTSCGSDVCNPNAMTHGFRLYVGP